MMNKEIVVEEIARVLASLARFGSLGNVLYKAELFIERLDRAGFQIVKKPTVIEVNTDEAGLQRLRDAVVEMQNKRLANG